MILTPIQKLANNVGDLVKIIVATSFEWLPKVQKIVKSGNTDYDLYGAYLYYESVDPPFRFLESNSRPIVRNSVDDELHDLWSNLADDKDEAVDITMMAATGQSVENQVQTIDPSIPFEVLASFDLDSFVPGPSGKTQTSFICTRIYNSMIPSQRFL